jgi:hypothetical protein
LLNPEGADSTSAGAAETTTTTLTLRSWPAAQISFSLSLSLDLLKFSFLSLVFALISRWTTAHLYGGQKVLFLFKEKSEAWRGGGVP